MILSSIPVYHHVLIWFTTYIDFYIIDFPYFLNNPPVKRFSIKMHK